MSNLMSKLFVIELSDLEHSERSATYWYVATHSSYVQPLTGNVGPFRVGLGPPAL
jgi:hypothetical protein